MSRIFGPEWRYRTTDGDMNFHGAVKKYFEIINEDVIYDLYKRFYPNNKEWIHDFYEVAKNKG